MEGQDKNFTKLFHVVVDSGAWATLRPAARTVYVVLLRHLDDVIRNCWPSNDVIANKAGIHPRSVSKATEELQKRGLLKKWRKDRKNFYHLPKEVLLPSIMDASTYPRKMGGSPPARRRNAKGRFTPPHAVDEQYPSPMDEPTPRKTDAVDPSNMDGKKSPRRRDKEEEFTKKKAHVSGPGSAGLKGQHAPETPQDPSSAGMWVSDREERSPGLGPCDACGAHRFWRGLSGDTHCATCHPPPSKRLIEAWLVGAGG